MKNIVSVKAMREAEARATAGGVSGKELMRRAAYGIFESVKWTGKIAIVCGKGNNGGDGYALCEILVSRGYTCKLFLIEDSFSDDGRYFYERCVQLNVECEIIGNAKNLFDGYSMIVDCIYGTGFSGSVGDRTAEIITEINEARCYVVSADINSGLNANSGLGEICVKSNLTVAVGSYKYGHILAQAKDVIKKLICCDIGVEVEEGCKLLEAEDLLEIYSERKHFSHKGVYGVTGIMGGSVNYVGASKLALTSCVALRAGCGVSRAIIPSCIYEAVASLTVCETLAVIPSADGYMLFDKQAIDAALDKVDSLAIGVGWGVCEQNQKILKYILESYALDVIIDADGLNNLVEIGLDILKTTKCRVVLTPHLGEFSRLSGVEKAKISLSPVELAESFAKEYKVVLLLKGTASIITDGSVTYLSDSGCSGMATAGSGDVLTGIICAMLAFTDAQRAYTVACGAYLAGVAGEIAESRINAYSMTAFDTASCVAQAVTKIIRLTAE